MVTADSPPERESARVHRVAAAQRLGAPSSPSRPPTGAHRDEQGAGVEPGVPLVADQRRGGRWWVSGEGGGAEEVGGAEARRRVRQRAWRVTEVAQRGPRRRVPGRRRGSMTFSAASPAGISQRPRPAEGSAPLCGVVAEADVVTAADGRGLDAPLSAGVQAPPEWETNRIPSSPETGGGRSRGA